MQSNPMKCLSHLILCLCLLLPAIEANAIAPTIVMLSPDLPEDLRPMITSTWITERTEAVNSYINDELSLKRNGFASSMAYKSGFQEKISSTPSLYSQTKPPINPRITVGHFSSYLSTNKITSTIDKDTPKGFVSSWPGLWLAVAAQMTKQVPKISWGSANKDTINDVKSSNNYKKMTALDLNSQVQSQLAYNNLLHLVSERIPQSPLNKKSQLEAQDEQANFRMRDGTWRNQMRAATTPAVEVARQTLFVLAEIRQELHQTRKDNERLLASVSMMQAQLATKNNQEMKALATKINQQLASNNH